MIKVRKCENCFYADECCITGAKALICEDYISIDEYTKRIKDEYTDEWNNYMGIHDSEHWYLDNN